MDGDEWTVYHFNEWMDTLMDWMSFQNGNMDGLIDWIPFQNFDGWLDWLPFQSRTMRSCQAPRNQELSPPEPTL